MDWESMTANEKAIYRELSAKIDSVKFYVFLLGGLTACIIWKLW